MDDPDAELVRRVRDGDRDAFGVLVRRHEGDARALATALAGDPAEAEDLAQDAFIRAFQNLDVLADPARFGGWLRRITFGVAIDWVRRHHAELFIARDHGHAAEIASPEPDPLERTERQELSDRVMRALERLPERHRTPLVFFHLDGLSHAAIAERLGVPVGTARSLVSRARRQLARTLAAEIGRTEPMQPLDEVFEPQHPGHPRLLHVLNGDATRIGLEQSRVPGTFTVWADVLHEGPVPPDDDMDRWLETRARFLSSRGAAGAAEALATLRRWRDALESYRAYDEVVLWFEHDLFDQLLLIRHLAWWTREDRGTTRLSLICIGEFPGIDGFMGLGQLEPDQLASLLDTRAAVTQRQLEIGRAAWHAFTGDDPRRLAAVLDRDTSALPFLAGAIRRMLEEYPSVHDGLPRTERQILRLLAPGPRTPADLFRANYANEERVFMGDATFLHRIVQLAAGPHPLVTLTTGAEATGTAAAVFQHNGRVITEVGLTQDGRAVLDGRSDAVRLNGTARWIGGVHLEGPAAAWRWDERHGTLVPVATDPQAGLDRPCEVG